MAELMKKITQQDYDDVENLKKNEKEDGQDEEEEEGRKPSVRNEYITPARNWSEQNLKVNKLTWLRNREQIKWTKWTVRKNENKILNKMINL